MLLECHHARRELKNIDQWRDAALEEFLQKNSLPPPDKRPTMLPLTQITHHSPNHFARKYGSRPWPSPRTPKLDPLHDKPPAPCGTILSDAPPLPGRAASNAEARAACWRVEHLRSMAMEDAAMMRSDAAAAL